MQDITIGDGQRGFSAVTCREIPAEGSIAHGGGWFWITHKYYNIRVYLQKLHPEGMILQRLLDKQASDKVVMNFLDKVVLARLSPKDIRGLITEAYNHGVKYGRREQAATIRQALML